MSAPTADSHTPLEQFEVHLEEAAFLWEQRRQALTAADTAFPWVSESVERRLLAHLDALALGGPRVARALLVPAGGAEEAGLVFSAAYALLLSGDADTPELVRAWLEAEVEAVSQGAAHALALAPRPELEPLLARWLPEAPPAVQVALLRALAVRGAAQDVRLEPFLRHAEPAVVLAALQAASRLPVPVEPGVLEPLLSSEDAEVRDAALETGLVRGLRPAWLTCAQRVREPEAPGWDAAARIWAMACDTDEKLALLAAALKVPARRAAAVRALGFTGRVAAADLLVELMVDKAVAPLAGEAFAAITGRTMVDRFAIPPEPPKEDADADAEEAPGPEADLPIPHARNVAQWWAEARGGFDRRVRYLWGMPFGWERMRYVLAEGPMRGRPVLALELALRTRGARQVTLEAWAARQHRELAVLAGLNEEHATRGLESMLGEGVARPPRARPPAEAPVSPVYHPGRMPSEALAITGLGMVSSLGDGVVDGCAAARAGLLRPCALEDVTAWDKDACEVFPVAGHAIPWLVEGFRGVARQVALGAAALADLLRQEPAAAPPPRTALFLVLTSGLLRAEAERRERQRASGGTVPPGGFTRAAQLRQQLEATLVRRLLEAVPVPGGVQQVELFFEDAPGLASALQAAKRALQSGKVERCLVGAIDCWVEPVAVSALETLRLLKTPDQAVGVIPGEGAAFVQVESAAAARRRGARIHACIDALAQAREPAAEPSRQPSGEALAGAISQVLAQRGAEAGPVALVIGNLNGVTTRAWDWGSALVRLTDLKLRELPDWHPALSFGETGAAAGVFCLCLAARAIARGYAPGPSALVWLWAEAGTRAALTVRAPESP